MKKANLKIHFKTPPPFLDFLHYLLFLLHFGGKIFLLLSISTLPIISSSQSPDSLDIIYPGYDILIHDLSDDQATKSKEAVEPNYIRDISYNIDILTDMLGFQFITPTSNIEIDSEYSISDFSYFGLVKFMEFPDSTKKILCTKKTNHYDKGTILV